MCSLYMLCFRIPRANLGLLVGIDIPVLDGLGDLVEYWKCAFGFEVARVEALVSVACCVSERDL